MRNTPQGSGFRRAVPDNRDSWTGAQILKLRDDVMGCKPHG
jgi:hypothetical protein